MCDPRSTVVAQCPDSYNTRGYAGGREPVDYVEYLVDAVSVVARVCAGIIPEAGQRLQCRFVTDDARHGGRERRTYGL